jgi:drug/metabolite transporter (DMT)-like permease
MSQTSPVQPPAQVKVPWNAYLAVGVALFAFSLGPVWIRLAQAEGIPSLLIAVVRLTGATLFFTPFVLSRYGAQLRQLPRRDLLLGAAAGFWMAAHFILVFLALENTTVLMSEVLGGTSMLWVALLEALAFRLRHGRQVWLGIAVALAGGILIALAGGSGSIGRNLALGGVLAIGGPLAMRFTSSPGGSCERRSSRSAPSGWFTALLPLRR